MLFKSSKATRLSATVATEVFDWSNRQRRGDAPPAARGDSAATLSEAAVPAAAAAPVAPAVDRDAIERDAFAQGYAQGERAGAEAAAARAEAVLRRLSQTIGELQSLRAEMIQKTERQVVELSIAMARRIVHREISLDTDLLTAMARVALERLGETTGATIRLHPDDYAAAAGARGDIAADAGVVRVVADGNVRRGGCLVQSELGMIDVSAEAQINELARALLGADDAGAQPQAEVSLVVA